MSYQATIERFEQLTNEVPNNTEHFRRLAESYAGLANVLPDWKRAARAYTEANRAYTQAIALQPKDSQLHDNRSRISFFLGNFRNALEDVESAIRLASEIPQNTFELRIGFYQRLRVFRTRQILVPSDNLFMKRHNAHVDIRIVYLLKPFLQDAKLRTVCILPANDVICVQKKHCN